MDNSIHVAAVNANCNITSTSSSSSSSSSLSFSSSSFSLSLLFLLAFLLCFSLFSLCDSVNTPHYVSASDGGGDGNWNVITLKEAQANVSLVANATWYCPSSGQSLSSSSSGSSIQDSSVCVPRVRLTPSSASTKGAAWTNKQIKIQAGFEVQFKFQIVEHSQTCTYLHGISTSCVTRGGHGFAFVLHDSKHKLNAIGEGLDGLGYANLDNSVAIEFDTWYNEELEDLYDNHISVQTRGYRTPNSAHHAYAVGISSDIPEMMDENIHQVKLVYNPVFNESFIDRSTCVDILACAQLQTLANFGNLFLDGYLPNGVGSLAVFVDDMSVAKFIAPIRLESVMNLTDNMVTMGFTASTGSSQWQIHEISQWSICTGTLATNSTASNCATVISG